MDVDLPSLETQLAKIRDEADAKLREVQAISKQVREGESNIRAVAATVTDKLGNAVNSDDFIRFFRKPYVVLPQGRHKALVAVPKFISSFEVGWLWKETDSFRIFQLDQHSAWLGEVPQDLLQELDIKREVQAIVDGNTVQFDTDQKEAVKKRLKDHIADVGETQARIIRGHEFQVLVELIEAGCLPFKPRPVAEGDKREIRVKFKPHSWQAPAIKRFEETGAIGVFHPTGAGKSHIAMYCMDMVKGKKLIIVPTRTLVEQWQYYLETHAPHLKSEVEVGTYQGYRVKDWEEFALVVFDEAHRLPADTFSRLATIRTKYRIGLSASPHREDGREAYIFSLTGFPVGLDWATYMRDSGRKHHPVNVHVVKTKGSKMAKLKRLLDSNKKTLVFCDGIELGKQISRELGVPFIWGESKDRLAEVKGNRVTVVSRVMDMGASITDLQRIIEVDFHDGSRAQELQRTGRLMHSQEEDLRHDIIFTEAEYHAHAKRLWALTSKGFDVKVVSDVPG